MCVKNKTIIMYVAQPSNSKRDYDVEAEKLSPDVNVWTIEHDD